MKTLTKIVVFTTLALGALLLFFLHKERKENKVLHGKIAELQQITSAKPQLKKVDSIVYRDVEHNIFAPNIIKSNDNAGKVYSIGTGLMDSLTGALKISEKNIASVLQVNATLRMENLKLQKIAQNKFQYKDDRVLITVDKEKDLLEEFKYKLTLNTVEYDKSAGFLKPKKPLLDVFSPDNRVDIGTVKSFSVQPREVAGRVYLDNQFMYYPNGERESQLLSLVRYDIGLKNTMQFGVGFGYNFDLHTREAYPVATGNLKINLLKYRR